MCVGSPTAGAWSSFQRRPDDEFETDRAPRIATANRVVPLSAQMIGLRFTAAAEAAGIERRLTAHSGMEGARERGCTGNTSLVIADYRLRPDPSIERHPRHPLNSQDERCCP